MVSGDLDGVTYTDCGSTTEEIQSAAIHRYVIALDTELLPLGEYMLTIPLDNGETVELTIEVGR